MRADFIHFNDIDLLRPESWKGKKILSFDIDWAKDEVLTYVIDLLEEKKIKCCFFITHETPVINRIRKNKNFELGIHPNFNPLLNNTATQTADSILGALKKIVPEANVFRSHSLTTSGSFLDLYKRHGAKYLSNYMMNGVESICPFYQVNGLIEVPICYADDGDLYLKSHPAIPRLAQACETTSKNSISVFNFHPIHVALNCVDYNNYVSKKNEVLTLEKMNHFSSAQNGIKNKLIQLIQEP